MPAPVFARWRIEPLPEALPENREPAKRLQQTDPVAPIDPGQKIPVGREGLTGSFRGGALGGRIPLPEGDSVPLLVVFALTHEGGDEHQASPADPLEVGR